MAKGFPGLPGGMGGLLEQAKKMQQEMTKAQEEASKYIAEGSAGGGAVKITADGTFDVKTVLISKEACSPEDVEMLQDLVKLAINDALGKVRENQVKKMSALTGGMKIPGLF